MFVMCDEGKERTSDKQFDTVANKGIQTNVERKKPKRKKLMEKRRKKNKEIR